MDNNVTKAIELLSPYRDHKVSAVSIETSSEFKEPFYGIDSLIIPEPQSLNEALYLILLVSNLYKYQLPHSDVPLFVRELAQDMANAIEREHDSKQIETVTLLVGEDGILRLPYRFVSVADPKVTIVFLDYQVEIHTSCATLIHKTIRVSEKQTIVTGEARYEQSGHYILRLSKRAMEMAKDLNGDYQIVLRDQRRDVAENYEKDAVAEWAPEAPIGGTLEFNSADGNASGVDDDFGNLFEQ